MDLYEVAVALALMVAGHALGDYPLQSDFIAAAKNRFSPVSGIGWWHGLFPHAAIHAGLVGLATGSLVLGLAEFVVHCVIDDQKCAGRFDLNTDQALHIGCKLCWAALLFAFGPIP